MKNWIAALKEKTFSRGHYSQSYQDILIDEIFSNIGTTNNPPFCVEFGFNAKSLTEGSGANVSNLVLNKKWASLLLDGDNENADINLHRHLLTSEDICKIFRTYNVPKIPEYISIDVDSTDLWLFQALLKEYRAMLFSVEYNANFPLDASITFPNDVNQRWEIDRGYGASLKALTSVANSHGYSLLWVVSPLDAFFIRNDLIDDGSGDLVFPFSIWSACTNRAVHSPLKNEKRLRLFVDFDEFIRSGGDIAGSTRSAHKTCKAFLTDSMDIQSIRRRGFNRFLRDIYRLSRRVAGSALRVIKL
jgi:hypothetical protein